MIILSKKIKIEQPFSGKTKSTFWSSLVSGDIVNISFSLRASYGRPVVVLTSPYGTFDDYVGNVLKYLDKCEYIELNN